MAGGILTKLGIGLSLFSLMFVLGIYLLTSLGNDYGVSVEDLYADSFSNTGSSTSQTVYESAELQQGGNIDKDSQDAAQLEGSIASERNKLNLFNVVKAGSKDIQNVVPSHPAIWATLLVIMTAIIGAGFYYALRGVNP